MNATERKELHERLDWLDCCPYLANFVAKLVAQHREYKAKLIPLKEIKGRAA